MYKNPGWSFQDVLPYFKKSEQAVFEPRDEYFHGVNGPLVVNKTGGVPILVSFLRLVV